MCISKNLRLNGRDFLPFSAFEIFSIQIYRYLQYYDKESVKPFVMKNNLKHQGLFKTSIHKLLVYIAILKLYYFKNELIKKQLNKLSLAPKASVINLYN